MPAYGAFEINREIGSGYGSAVYSARKAGEAAETCAVKVYALDALVGDNSQNRSDLNPLLEDLDQSLSKRIELQKRAAAASKHIAPILESGQVGQEIWYATKLYSLSVQRIIAGHVTLSRENLCHVLRSIVRGALDLKNISGRTHGNLKASNVLISGGGKMLDAEVVLSDPLPGGATEARRYEGADLRAIGEILLQLVRRRELAESNNWLILPVETSAEWAQLFGKDASAWLALCNRLLDPNLAPERFGLAQLDAELAGLQPKPPVSLKTLVLATAGVVVVAGALVVLLLPSNQGRVVLTSDPTGAALFMDGQATELGKTPFDQKLPKGQHTFVAKFGELSSSAYEVNVEGGKKHEFLFRFAFSTIVIESEPKGASIRLGTNDLFQSDGRAPARTPYTHRLFLPPGTKVEYQLSLDDQHGTASIRTNVPPAGESLTVMRELAKIEIGKVGVEFNRMALPIGETIALTVDGLPQPPFQARTSDRTSITPGEHTIVAQCRDLPPVRKTIVVEKGRINEVPLDFEFGLVFLSKSEPPGVLYSIDNDKETRPIGSEEVAVPIALGKPVSFSFKKDGYDSTNRTFRIDVRNGRQDFTPQLRQVVGVAELTFDPPGPGSVSIRGVTNNYATNYPIASAQPAMIPLPPGNYQAVASIAGLVDVQQPLRIESGKRFPASFEFAYASLRLKSNLERTMISFGPRADQWITLDPTQTFYLPPGTNTLVARDPLHGLPDEGASLLLQNKQQGTYTFVFRYGTINFTSSPPNGVEVLMNGARVGVTPLTTNFVREGEVEYKLSLMTDPKKFRLRKKRVASGSTNFWGEDLTKDEGKSYTNKIHMELVSVGERLYVGRFEVTQDQYKSLMKSNTVEGVAPNQPVRLVTPHDALEFCRLLNEQTEEQNSLRATLGQGWSYGLPRESEWVLFGSTNLGGLDDAVFTLDKALDYPKDIDPMRGSTNNLGLYDLYGNVAEMCQLETAGNPIYAFGGDYTRPKGLIRNGLTTQLRQGPIPENSKARNIGFRCLLRQTP